MYLLLRILFLKVKIKLLKIVYIYKLNIIYNVINSYNFLNSLLLIKVFFIFIISGFIFGYFINVILLI